MILRVARLFCYANERDASVLWGLEGAWFPFVGSVNYRKKSDLAASWWRVGLFIIIPLDSLYLPRRSQGAYARPGYTPAMQLVTPRAVAMAVRIEMAVWMTKRHTCLFFSSMIFLSFKGLIMSTSLCFSVATRGHAKKTTNTTFTIFYNQVCFANSISSLSLG